MSFSSKLKRVYNWKTLAGIQRVCCIYDNNDNDLAFMNSVVDLV